MGSFKKLETLDKEIQLLIWQFISCRQLQLSIDPDRKLESWTRLEEEAGALIRSIDAKNREYDRLLNSISNWKDLDAPRSNDLFYESKINRSHAL